mmetsp:Transcript_11349/g.16676  ORF Transcript_11349/g.16676 Transcript_11349/m.16676 type:complete len:260 (+) Transcript_11349:122-901(+)
MNRNTFNSQHPVNRLNTCSSIDADDNSTYSERINSSSLYPPDCMIPNQLDELELISTKRIRRRDCASLYPPSSSMPNIPLADDVFDQLQKDKEVSRRNSSSSEKPSNQSNNNQASSSGLERIQRISCCHQQDCLNINPIDDDDESSIEKQRPLIEISPGHWIELRGSTETLKAFQNKFFCQVECYGCSHQIQCIGDAAMILCPTCRVVIPIDNERGRGLGLGVKVESTHKYSSKGDKSDTGKSSDHSMHNNSREVFIAR